MEIKENESYLKQEIDRLQKENTKLKQDIQQMQKKESPPPDRSRDARYGI